MSSTTAHPSCTQLLDMPAGLLASIMQEVPVQERLGVCTRVCRAFHAAAREATTSIQLQQGTVQLESLRALQGLTQLVMDDCCVQSTPHASSSAGINPLTQLSGISSLEHLSLGSVRGNGSVANPEGTVLEFPSSLLPHLVQLTCLKLGLGQVQTDAALQHLSAVSALRHLDLDLSDWYQELTAAALTGREHLQQLTALKLYPLTWDINLQSMPAITLLTALRVLDLHSSASVDPAVLAGLSQLQEVYLACPVPWDAEDCAAMLSGIGLQQGLRQLNIRNVHCWSSPSAAAYSALTASSQLQHLELLSGELPAGVWQQMFQPTRRLPELHNLGFEGADTTPWQCPAQQLGAADMQALVSCCPALDSLKLGPQVRVLTLAPLQQLTGLTSLYVYAPFKDNTAAVAKITGLQRLVLRSHQYDSLSSRLTVSGLLQLTVLRQLQFLSVDGSACDPGLAPLLVHSPSRPWLTLSNEAAAGAPTDVWLQLKSRCEDAQQGG